jgi:hypothetical protein
MQSKQSDADPKHNEEFMKNFNSDRPQRAYPSPSVESEQFFPDSDPEYCKKYAQKYFKEIFTAKDVPITDSRIRFLMKRPCRC